MHHSFCIIVCYRAVRSAILATAGLLVNILPPLHSLTNCLRSPYIIYHLASNLLLQYLAKFECSTAQLYSKVLKCKCRAQLLLAFQSIPRFNKQLRCQFLSSILGAKFLFLSRYSGGIIYYVALKSV